MCVTSYLEASETESYGLPLISSKVNLKICHMYGLDLCEYFELRL